MYFAVIRVIRAAQLAAQKAPPTLTTWLASNESGQDEDETLAGFLSEINSLEFGEFAANLQIHTPRLLDHESML